MIRQRINKLCTKQVFLNGNKAIMLMNGDVIMYRKNLVFDKKCNFECLMAESKVDGNMYLIANEMEPSFSSTIFTLNRSEKDVQRGYLSRIQAFNGSKRTIKHLEQELKASWVNLKISGPTKAWRFSEKGTESCPARLKEVKVSPADEFEYFKIYLLQVIALQYHAK